jgi:hypothetical protein
MTNIRFTTTALRKSARFLKSMMTADTYLMSSCVVLQKTLLLHLTRHRRPGCFAPVLRLGHLLRSTATTDRLGLRTTGMQTYTEQQSDSHRPVEARLSVKQLVISHM